MRNMDASLPGFSSQVSDVERLLVSACEGLFEQWKNSKILRTEGGAQNGA